MENSSVSSDRSATVFGTIARPQWLDEQLYPFQSRFVEVEGNRIHYIDEGNHRCPFIKEEADVTFRFGQNQSTTQDGESLCRYQWHSDAHGERSRCLGL